MGACKSLLTPKPIPGADGGRLGTGTFEETYNVGKVGAEVAAACACLHAALSSQRAPR